MTTDKADFNRTNPAAPLYYDTDFNYSKDRSYWLRLMLGMWVATYVSRKYYIERDRARRTNRMEGYPNMPGHHFNNRGGVVVLKDFAGFEKYF